MDKTRRFVCPVSGCENEFVGVVDLESVVTCGEHDCHMLPARDEPITDEEAERWRFPV